MKLNGNFNRLLDHFYKLVSIVGSKKTCHILDTNGVCTHFFKFFCVLSEAFVCVSFYVGGADRVADSRLNVAAFFNCSLDSCFKVSLIVERVKNSDDVDTVCYGFLNEVFNNVVCVVAVAENILTAEKHLKLCIFYLVTDLAKSFPRVFVQETEAGVESSAAPCFDSIVAYFVHLFKDGKHFFRCHSCCNQGLMRVTDDSFTNFNLCHILIPFEKFIKL